MGRMIPVMLLLGISWGCLDEEATENAICQSGEDCLRSQECFRTPEQTGLLGWCRPKGEGCAEGLQPGCQCKINSDGITASCEDLALTPTTPNNPLTCICTQMGADTGTTS